MATLKQIMESGPSSSVQTLIALELKLDELFARGIEEVSDAVLLEITFGEACDRSESCADIEFALDNLCDNYTPTTITGLDGDFYPGFYTTPYAG